MGQPIVRQPDGKFAIFSAERDTFVALNRSREYVILYFEELVAQRERANIEQLLDRLEAGENPYGHLAYSWEEMLALDRDHGGTAWQELQETDSLSVVAPSGLRTDPGIPLPIIHASNAIAHPLIRKAIAERNRQLREKGFTPLHDAEHTNGELRRAAAAYATGSMSAYPWLSASKVAWTDPAERLVRAMALLLAEWDRVAAEVAQQIPTHVDDPSRSPDVSSDRL